LAQGRGSVTYESRAPTGSSQYECSLLPHYTQSTPSSSSTREQNCCTQTRLGTFNFALSVFSVFRGVSKSWNTYSTLSPVEATRGSVVLYNTSDLFFSGYSYHSTACSTHAFRVSRVYPHVTQHRFSSHTDIIAAVLYLWFAKIATSRMPVTFGAMVANMGERARRFGHSDATVCSQTCLRHVHLLYCMLYISTFLSWHL